MGALYVNDFNKAGRVYRVQLQAEANYRMKPDDIGKVYVRSTTTNAMIPLSAISKVKNVVGPEQVERFNGFIAAKIMGDSKPGISSGDAIRIVEEVAAATLPDGYGIAWTGQAFQEKRSSGSSLQAFGFAIIMVFLILAAQYEKWSLPVAVVMAVPFALMGALTAIWLRGMPNDIYFQIGLVVLIGLASKNAILIVEFAAQKYAEGMSAADAAIEAARLRLRPIIIDLARLRARRFPAGQGHRCRCRCPSVDGYRRLRRHAGCHLHRHAVHSALLQVAGARQANRSLAPRHERGGKSMISRPIIRLTPLAFALALSGCAIGPDYLRPASLLPAVFSEAKPAENVAVATNPAINPNWWTLFNDATLNNLVDQALTSNASLRLAVARVEQADALAREAGASFFPQIDGSAGISNTKASTRTATFVATQPRIRQSRSIGLSTSFELDVWGRIRRANEAARATLLGQPVFARRDSPQHCRAGLRHLSRPAAYDAQLVVTAETVKTREESLKLVKTRVDAGLASPLDGYQAEGLLAAAEAQLAEQRRLRTLAEHQLALITGNPALKIAAGDLKQLPLLPEAPAGLPSDLIEGRPDVRQAEQELVAANAGIGMAKAGYFPKFTLTGSLGTESRTLSDLFSAGSNTWSLGLGALDAYPRFRPHLGTCRSGQGNQSAIADRLAGQPADSLQGSPRCAGQPARIRRGGKGPKHPG